MTFQSTLIFNKQNNLPHLLGILIGTFFCFLTNLQAQDSRQVYQETYKITAQSTKEAIKIDGDLSEPIWKNAQKITNFWLKWPRDGEQAKDQTEIQIAYDETNLYIAATCFDEGPFIIQSLKRDAKYWSSDGIAVMIDPANRATNGYFFGSTPDGVQSEGLVVDGNDDSPDFTWDNKWRVETKKFAGGWTTEFAIPFRILRFENGKTDWGINFIRNNPSKGEYHTWSKIPLQFDGINLGWTGKLVFPTAPQPPKANFAVIPYVTNSVSKNFEDNEKTKNVPNAGIDAKIGVGSALNLDLTLNPDFSQVEIDQQVINLTRFDVQLPEKRTFFLENADIFGRYGIPPIRPFFSRKIGLDADGNAVPIVYGARLTGNLNPKTRIGVMNMHTNGRTNNPNQNYTSLSCIRQLKGRSELSGYFLNRQDFKGTEAQKNGFSRNAGGSFDYISLDGAWNAWASWHHSFKPGTKKLAGWGNSGTAYRGRRFDFVLDFLSMGENYEADMGFETRIRNYDVLRDTTLRIGYKLVFLSTNYKFIPKKEGSKFNYTSIGYEQLLTLNPDFSLNELNSNLSYTLSFRNTVDFGFGVEYARTNVPVFFKFDDKSNAECPPLSPGLYDFTKAGFEFNSDSRKRVNFSIEAGGGEFYNGKTAFASVELSYRAQPWGNIRIQAEYNYLNFPAPYCDAELLAITPRLELFFNKNLNWTTFLQYNTQADNFNINSRLQWRYRPMSDFFLVYTDNYTVNIWGVKNRAFVAKLNYWF
jgi:Domain of unknown function (DUF5916)/Carbohydrate family 9 binding domain-like